MIVVTGPISSGTRLTTRLLQGWGFDVEHRSMPHWDRFWGWDRFEADTRFVIITRRPDISTRSAHRQGHGNPNLQGWEHLDHRLTEEELMEWWIQAMRRLADFPRAWWMTYEGLTGNPQQQMGNLAHWLGMEEMPELSELVYDGNAQWL